jgi:hypothetical protein
VGTAGKAGPHSEEAVLFLAHISLWNG